MKRHLSVLLLWLLLPCKTVNAQSAHLRVSQLINWPDTVYNNQNLPVGAVVENIGNAVYQGALQIILQTDSLTYSYLYFNQSTSVTILPGDSLLFSPPNGYTFDSTVFRPGNNVVVVWPYSVQAVLIDSVITHTFFIKSQLQGFPEAKSITGLKVFPNPAGQITYLQSPDIAIERVRIFSMQGQELQNIQAGGSRQIELPMFDFPVGLYLLEIIALNGDRSVYRLLKE